MCVPVSDDVIIVARYITIHYTSYVHLSAYRAFVCQLNENIPFDIDPVFSLCPCLSLCARTKKYKIKIASVTTSWAIRIKAASFWRAAFSATGPSTRATKDTDWSAWNSVCAKPTARGRPLNLRVTKSVRWHNLTFVLEKSEQRIYISIGCSILNCT